MRWPLFRKRETPEQRLQRSIEKTLESSEHKQFLKRREAALRGIARKAEA